ncbi:tetratricopeptide repeat protein [Maribellus mangrovi]|uniref:tetratricopeptide repeat protein n=1 Tax=Maribellus mangrovi TaxID=3133146 RepID=UPI0030EF9709
MNLKSILLLILAFMVNLNVVAQVNVDSLKTRYYADSGSAEEKAEIAAKIADALVYNQPDSANLYANSGLEIAKKHNFADGIFHNNYVLGRIELNRENLDGAAHYFTNAVAISNQLENISLGLNAFQMLAYVYDMQNQYLNAYKVYRDGIKLAEEINDSVKLYSLYNNFGSHLQHLGDFEESKLMFLKTLEVAAALQPEQLRFSPASAYSNLSVIYMDSGDLDSALYFLNQAWTYPGSRADAYGEQTMATNYTDIYLSRNKPDSVRKYLAIQKNDLEKMEGSFPGSLDFQYAKSTANWVKANLRMANCNRLNIVY